MFKKITILTVGMSLFLNTFSVLAHEGEHTQEEKNILALRQEDFNIYVQKIADFQRSLDRSKERMRNEESYGIFFRDFNVELKSSYAVTDSLLRHVYLSSYPNEVNNGTSNGNILTEIHYKIGIANNVFGHFDFYSVKDNEKEFDNAIRKLEIEAKEKYKIYLNSLKEYMKTYHIKENTNSKYIFNYKMDLPEWTSFTDIKTHWAKYDIKNMERKSIAQGKKEDLFEPNSNVTRAEFVVFLLRTLGIEEKAYEKYSFSDLNKSFWFSNAVQTAVNEGLISGYQDKSFKPNKNISREEMAVLLIRAYNYKKNNTIENTVKEGSFQDENEISKWAKEDIEQAVSLGFMGGLPDNTFAPTKNSTRSECIVTLNRLLNKIE